MTAKLIDTHCHLTFPELLADADRIVREAADAGVTRTITIACHQGDLAAAMSLRERHPSVFVAAGAHPHEAAKVDEAYLQELVQAWRQPGVVAAGEMGLDYHYDFSPRDVQERVFRQQLDLAAEAQLPVIIHCREAHADVVRLLNAHGYRGRRVVFHCFSGTPEEAAEIRGHGWWTSFTGLITFKNAQPQQEAVAATPEDQLMFETDAPYLSPEPVRRQRPNTPANVAHTVRFAAMLRGQTFDSLAAASTANAERFFNLPK